VKEREREEQTEVDIYYGVYSWKRKSVVGIKSAAAKPIVKCHVLIRKKS